jgi:hypothetical protein
MGPYLSGLKSLICTRRNDTTFNAQTLWYTDNRFPAPQYCIALPEHTMLQSDCGAVTDPALKLFPQ